MQENYENFMFDVNPVIDSKSLIYITDVKGMIILSSSFPDISSKETFAQHENSFPMVYNMC